MKYTRCFVWLRVYKSRPRSGCMYAVLVSSSGSSGSNIELIITTSSIHWKVKIMQIDISLLQGTCCSHCPRSFQVQTQRCEPCNKRKNCGGGHPAAQTQAGGSSFRLPRTSAGTPPLYDGASDHASSCMHERGIGNRRLVSPRPGPLSMRMTKLKALEKGPRGAAMENSALGRHSILRVQHSFSRDNV